jgi:hypothetical protein
VYVEALYSFQPREMLTELVRAQPELAPLAAIQAKLVEAAALADARRYQAAIVAYQAAQGMIFGHLTARTPLGSSSVNDLPMTRDLFEPLLSAAAEWLNVLPVTQPPPVVRPRIAVDEDLLAQAAPLVQTGLFSAELSTSAAIKSSADFQLAALMESAGNVNAAQFFRARAQEHDETTFTRFTEALALRDGGVQRDGSRGALGFLTTFTGETSLRMAEAASSVGNRAQDMTAALQLDLPVEITSVNRTLTTAIGGEVRSMTWSPGEGPSLTQITDTVYAARRDLTDLIHLIIPPRSPAEVALQLPHNYYYVIPLGLAECYRGLGDFERAESEYLKAADYQFLNNAIEAPFVWLRLAETYVLWGNALYLADEVDLARQRYEQVFNSNGEPASVLYAPTLAAGAQAARTVVAHLDTLLSGETEAASLNVNPEILAVVLEAYEHLTKIDAGLDFWGQTRATVPIWTFDYLHSLAVNFTQLAISAERDFIQFQERSDQGAMTRTQLRQQLNVARAEKAAVKRQVAVADAEVRVYQSAVEVSDKRADNAWAQVDDYAQMTGSALMYRTLSAYMSGGAKADDVIAYADVMMGRTPTSGHLYYRNGKLTGSKELFAGAFGLIADRLGAEYEVRSLQRQAEELELITQQARLQVRAAEARAKAARAAVVVSEAREHASRQVLAAFNAQFFTPEVWGRMAETMRALARRYLQMAIRTARLMQRAYNFETDQDLDIIKLDYAAGDVNGLLAADLLMADIQSFTFDMLTATRSKPQQLRSTISLSERHAHAFENQLRRTGVMEFQTTLEEFDEHFPGTYGARIEAIEVAIDGIIPPMGISGALTNEGFSHYRTAQNDIKSRMQSSETLILSDFDVRTDALLNPQDQRMLRVFQGAGLASAWRLELPPQLNDIDYQTLTDVRITFHYQAYFDPRLRESMLQELAARPDAHERQLGLPLRWLYPDAFFAFYVDGVLEIPIEAAMFSPNQLSPTVKGVGLIIVTAPDERASGISLQVSAPNGEQLAVTTDEHGSVPVAALDALAGSDITGTWRIALDAADNPGWVTDGRLDLDAIRNIALILNYTFTPRRTLP